MYGMTNKRMVRKQPALKMLPNRMRAAENPRAGRKQGTAGRTGKNGKALLKKFIRRKAMNNKRRYLS